MRSMNIWLCVHTVYVNLAIQSSARTICAANSCSHICAVVGGKDKCFCPVGLELAVGSTTTCIGTEIVVVFSSNIVYMLTVSSYKDINECSRFKPCDQVCTNTEGSFICSCNSGFQLQNATQLCEGIRA